MGGCAGIGGLGWGGGGGKYLRPLHPGRPAPEFSTKTVVLVFRMDEPIKYPMRTAMRMIRKKIPRTILSIEENIDFIFILL